MPHGGSIKYPTVKIKTPIAILGRHAYRDFDGISQRIASTVAYSYAIRNMCVKVG